MEVTLGNIVQLIVITGFVSGVVKLVIVTPLLTSINSLKDAIKEMKDTLTRQAEEQKGIDKRLVAVEESTKSAHKRLDGIEGLR